MLEDFLVEAGMDLTSEFKGPFRAQVTFRLGHEPGQKQARIVSLTVGICFVFSVG